MEPLSISVLPQLQETGAYQALDGVLDCTDFEFAGDDFATPDGIAYDLQLSNTEDAILLRGTVKARLDGRCHRCLEPTSLEVEGEVEGYFLMGATEAPEDMEEDEFSVVDESGIIDITDNIMAGLVHEIPQTILCTPDCKGLCPGCGANLNTEPCTCPTDEVDPSNPFAVLKDLDLGDGED
ncbi:MAG: DUF177 domain-containing protein [Coriobacteriaceae bacterium]|nr:DUF177 domain-containing protein [Coriobacteriaceae bacterium]